LLLLRLALVLGALLAACGPGAGPSDEGADQNGGDALNGAQVAAFQDGVAPTAAYAGATDAMLQESTPSTNRGSNTFIQLDRDYQTGSHQSTDGLLRFELSGIPAGATVQSVQLTLNVTNPTSGEGYAVYPARKAWSETAATWNDAAAGSPWSAGGARGSADRGETSFATLNASAVGSSTVTFNAAGVAEVQGWLDTPARNHGLVLDAQTNTDGLVFDTSEVGTAGHRPKLTVTYLLPAPPAGNGTGLLGEYFAGTDLQARLLSRTDAAVAFDWGTGSPAPSVPADGFSVRWSGTVLPLYSETYTFYTQSDDGVRVWINGQAVIDNWTDHASTENSGTFALTAGQKVDVKVEYFENAGAAVAKLSWSSASQTKELIPTSQLFPAAAPPAASTLDETGATLPDTNYPIPAGAIFLSPQGDDSHAGTQAAPVRTLAKAISLVPSGGTVVARGGLYRDGSTSSVYKRFTLQAYPHEQPWFDGTDVVTGWQTDGSGHWKVSWNTPSFCGGHYYDLPYNQQTQTGPCAYLDEYGDPANPAAADPQMVFLDGVYVHEVTTLAEATGKNFFYDQANKVLYLGTNPAGHTVELSARPNALVLQGSPTGGNVIRGIGFKRYASNEYGANATQAAVLANSPNLTFENNVFTLNAGGGLGVADPRGASIHLNVFAKNGGNGMDSNGHEHSGTTPDGIVVDRNIFNANNQERFGPGCGYSCSAAGVKMAHMNGFTLSNNLFENGVVAKGFWCDLACNHGVMVHNIVRNNGDTGLMYEVSDTGIIASNLIYGNGKYGLKIGAANTKVYNNTVVDNGTGALLYDDDRTLGVGGWSDVGPDTVNLDFSNNLISGGTKMIQAWRTSATAPNTGPNTFFSGLDANAFYRPSGAPAALYEWRDGATAVFASCTALQNAHGWEGDCLDFTSGGDPFFVDAAAHDYRVRPDSAAYESGKPLPSDVAAALGVPSGQPVSRGALDWPGRP